MHFHIWQKIILFFISACVLFFGCGPEKKVKQEGPLTTVTLELVDSLIVHELDVLAMDDYSPENGLFLIKGIRSRKPYLVNEKGLIMKEFEILDDGPNGLGNGGAWGYRFLDKDSWVAQGFHNQYHVYNLEGKKILKIALTKGKRTGLRVYTFRTTFTPYIQDGIPYILGEAPHLIDPVNIYAENAGAEFYNFTRMIYWFNLNNGKINLLETYPKEWEPRQKNRFVGPSFPFVSYQPKKKEMALLPVMGNQLFIYEMKDSLPLLKHIVELRHRFRPVEAPLVDINNEPGYSDYPEFTDLRILEDYYLIGFRTKIPEDIMLQIKSKGNSYYSLPEYKMAQEQYDKPYYLLVKNGKQVGILKDFPVQGDLDLTDEAGFLYVNDNVSTIKKRSYNIFYKLKIQISGID